MLRKRTHIREIQKSNTHQTEVSNITVSEEDSNITEKDDLTIENDKLEEDTPEQKEIEKQSTVVQTLIFSKDRFNSKSQVKDWLKESNFKLAKPLDETETSYRARQKAPGLFKQESFRTIAITDGVKAVIGLLKTVEKSADTINPEQYEASDIDNENLEDYMVKQDGTSSKRFVIQRHFSDLWSDCERAKIKKELLDISKAYLDKEDNVQEALKSIWDKHQLCRLTASIKQIQKAIKLSGNDFNVVLKDMASFLDTNVPDIEELSKAMPDIVNIGSAHVDLRLEASDDDVISWMLDTPGLVVQTLNGKLLPVRRDAFNQNAKNDFIDINKKPKQSTRWLDLVTIDKSIYSVKTSDKNIDEFRYVDEGQVIYGFQKSDCHEYFLFFNKNKELNGRWLAYKGKNWVLHKPHTQIPSIHNNELEYNKALSAAQDCQMLWNPDTLDALNEIGFNFKEHSRVLNETKIDKSFYNSDETIVSLSVDKSVEEERMVFGVVLEPDTVDAHCDTIDAETIRKAAHMYLEFYQQKGYQHGHSEKYPQFPDGLRLMESYIAPINMSVNGRKIKAGSWLMTMRVDHDGIWEDIKGGLITGFSISGLARMLKDDE